MLKPIDIKNSKHPAPMLVLASLVAILLTANLVGCGSQSIGPNSIDGTVLLDGEPVQDARVVFVPESLKWGKPFELYQATTDSEGDFRLTGPSTNSTDQPQPIPFGKYRVIISSADYSGDPENSESDEVSTKPGAFSDPLFEAVEQNISLHKDERIPFYYNHHSELYHVVDATASSHNVTFKLTSVDPILLENQDISEANTETGQAPLK